jgi:hypothetical protein
LKHFRINPLKATLLEKFTFTTVYTNKFYFLPSTIKIVAGRRPLQKICGMPQSSVKSLWHAADHPKKTGLYVFTCLFCGGADRRRKIGRLTVPVAAGSQIVFSREQTV